MRRSDSACEYIFCVNFARILTRCLLFLYTNCSPYEIYWYLVIVKLLPGLMSGLICRWLTSVSTNVKCNVKPTRSWATPMAMRRNYPLMKGRKVHHPKTRHRAPKLPPQHLQSRPYQTRHLGSLGNKIITLSPLILALAIHEQFDTISIMFFLILLFGPCIPGTTYFYVIILIFVSFNFNSASPGIDSTSRIYSNKLSDL